MAREGIRSKRGALGTIALLLEVREIHFLIGNFIGAIEQRVGHRAIAATDARVPLNRPSILPRKILTAFFLLESSTPSYPVSFLRTHCMILKTRKYETPNMPAISR